MFELEKQVKRLAAEKWSPEEIQVATRLSKTAFRQMADRLGLFKAAPAEPEPLAEPESEPETQQGGTPGMLARAWPARAPEVVCNPGWAAYRELEAIAARDGVTIGEAAAALLMECLTDEETAESEKVA